MTNNFDRQRKLLALNVDLWPFELHRNQIQKYHPTFVINLNVRTIPFAVHYEKIRIRLCETATNSAEIHSLAQKSEHLRPNQIQ